MICCIYREKYVYIQIEQFRGPGFAFKQNLLYESQPIQLRTLEPSQEHSRGSTEFPNQNLRQIGYSMISYDRRYKQTNRDYYFILINLKE